MKKKGKILVCLSITVVTVLAVIAVIQYWKDR